MWATVAPASRKACVPDSAGLGPLRMASALPPCTRRAHGRLLGCRSWGPAQKESVFSQFRKLEVQGQGAARAGFWKDPFWPCRVLAWPHLCAQRGAADSGVSSSSHKAVSLSDWHLTLMTSLKAPSPEKVTWKVRASTWDCLWRGGGRRRDSE